jgi:hypothetical protein
VTPEEFVSAIDLYVRDPAVESTISALTKPAGRRPRAHIKAVSEWYNGLSAEDAARVRQVIRLAADSSLFSLLVVLDGGSVIDDEKGEFALLYNGKRLNPPTMDLHDLLTTPWNSDTVWSSDPA